MVDIYDRIPDSMPMKEILMRWRKQHKRMRKALDAAVKLRLGLEPGDWDDDERTRTNQFLSGIKNASRPSPAADTADFIDAVIQYLIEKYDLTEL